jgi:hypothetical protein
LKKKSLKQQASAIKALAGNSAMQIPDTATACNMNGHMFMQVQLDSLLVGKSILAELLDIMVIVLIIAVLVKELSIDRE